MKRNSKQILTEWLVLSAQLGEADAMAQLLRIFYPRLLRFASRQLGDPDVAAEVVQNTLEVMSRDIRRLSDPAAFPKWVYQILHRKGVDHIRRATRQRRLTEAIHAEPLAEAPAVDEPMESAHVSSLLARLDDSAYQVVHLHYLEGLSIKEIAKALGLAQGTVKSRLFYARERLKKWGEADD